MEYCFSHLIGEIIVGGLLALAADSPRVRGTLAALIAGVGILYLAVVVGGRENPWVYSLAIAAVALFIVVVIVNHYLRARANESSDESSIDDGQNQLRDDEED